MNLFEKIQAVSNDIRTIEKDMQIGSEKYGYKAVSDLAVTKSVKKAEANHKIISIPYKQELLNQEVLKKVVDGKETYNYSFVIKLTTKIVNLENPDEFIEIESFGHGLDSGDKGFGKAATYARKYALLNAYKIATGEDPDKEASKREQAPKSVSEQKIALLNFLNKDHVAASNVAKYYNVQSFEDLKERQILEMYNSLKSKGKL